MTSEITLFVNPTAGRGRGARAAQPAASALRAAGFSVRTVLGEDAADALVRARAAVEAGTAALIAVGGDGMAGLALRAVAGTRTPLGLVAVGTGNDFARALGLPGDPEGVARVLLHGTPRAVDTIEVTSSVHAGTVVLGSVYAGVDALANLHANRSRLLRGSASYYAGALRAISTWRPVGYRITVDGQEHTCTGYTVVAANSSYYGSARRIAPEARLDDGLLDVVMIRDAPRRLFFALMKELDTGAHIHRPQVRVLRGREIRIEADRDLPYGADGEIEAALPVTARVLPGALRVLC
ncbi:diacylglycerol/lipid kinase family protein [Streptomyces sp. NRRL S-146]|uniref:diacylglycerol/lipid kinase family protein n=1 Tax=Streptomyces sp. NRRL S-146 TaxID=1463884 RepID=UPI0004CB6C95|nr:YegS/Rv2252/BmrU family lipid kinase [Streptomyces sp. NRRL S-146]